MRAGRSRTGEFDGDLDADVANVLDVPFHGLDREAVGGDGQAQEAPGLRGGFEDLHGVSESGELPGRGQSGRPAAHDRHLLAIRWGDLDSEPVVRRVVLVGDEALDPPNRERALERAAGALALARGVAGATQGADQRRRIQDEPVGLLVFAAADERDVPVRLDARRARIGTGRRALALDDRLLRHGLRERDVGGSAGDQVVVELVGHGHGACLLAELAACTGHLVYEPGLLADGRPDHAVIAARDLVHLRVRHRGDVGVVDRGRHLGGRDAARAVQRREDLGQQDHPAADARFLLDEQDVVAHVAELERRLHAGDAAAYHEGVVLGHDLAPADRIAMRASEN